MSVLLYQSIDNVLKTDFLSDQRSSVLPDAQHTIESASSTGVEVESGHVPRSSSRLSEVIAAPTGQADFKLLEVGSRINHR